MSSTSGRSPKWYSKIIGNGFREFHFCARSSISLFTFDASTNISALAYDNISPSNPAPIVDKSNLNFFYEWRNPLSLPLLTLSQIRKGLKSKDPMPALVVGSKSDGLSGMFLHPINTKWTSGWTNQFHLELTETEKQPTSRPSSTRLQSFAQEM